MMFVTGPAFSGKRAFVRKTFGWNEEELARLAVCDAQDLVCTSTSAASGGPASVMRPDEIQVLADELATHEVIIACELGAGVVPMAATQRAHREEAGRLACLLAERATTVVRVCCGLPQVLKDTSVDEASRWGWAPLTHTSGSQVPEPERTDATDSGGSAGSAPMGADTLNSGVSARTAAVGTDAFDSGVSVGAAAVGTSATASVEPVEAAAARMGASDSRASSKGLSLHAASSANRTQETRP